jgi:hypothetical protein
LQDAGTRRQVALFPAGSMPVDDVDAIGVRLSKLSLRRPGQWGACWLALQLWQQLELDSSWRVRPSVFVGLEVGAGQVVQQHGLEQAFVNKTWANVRDGVQVKRLATDEDVYMLAQGDARIDRERGMRPKLRIPLIADTHSKLIADSVPRDRGHPGWGA